VSPSGTEADMRPEPFALTAAVRPLAFASTIEDMKGLLHNG
jgi:hypothetical protein